MKKKYILPITLIIFVSTIIFPFAQSYKTVEYKDTEGMVLRHNRYYYTYEYNKLIPYDIYISEDESKNEEKFRRVLFDSLGDYFGSVFLPISVIGPALTNYIFDSFYRSPYAAAGDYKIIPYDVKRIQNDRLTGEKRIVERGYKFVVEHNGQSIEKTFWR